MFEQACGMGLEGIVSKRRDLPYRSGRTESWVKVKCTRREEFVIAGYIPAASSSRAVGALVLGRVEQGELVYVGRVGTGFTERTSRELWATLDKLRAEKPAFAAGAPPGGAARKTVWVEPRLVAEVEFRGFTGEGLLRTPHTKARALLRPARAREPFRSGPRAVP